MGVFNKDFALFDFEHAVGVVAQLKYIAGHAFKSEVFIQRADKQAFRLQDDLVIELIGYRPAVQQRRQPRALARPQHAVNGVPVQIRAAPAAPGVETVAEHFDDGDKLLVRQFPVRPSNGKRLIQIVFMPFAAGNLGDDLLRQHIQRLLGNGDTVQFVPLYRRQHGRAFHQIVARQRKQASFRNSAQLVAGTPHPLQKSRDRMRRTQLANQIDIAYIDAQLQRRRRHQRFERALF